MRHRRTPHRNAGLLAAVLLTLAGGLALGCGPKPPPASSLSDCPEFPGRVRDRDRPVVIALCDEVRPDRVRTPRNDSEWIVFRHLYEGLVDVDCEGRLVPRLAESWTTEDDGRVWTFRLHSDRRFADGTPVDAAAVVESWREARSEGRTLAHRRWMWEGLPLRQVRAEGLLLTVSLRAPDPELPFRLSFPEFFVLRPGPGDWPLGTRDRIAQTGLTADGVYEITCPAAPADADRSPPITFRVTPGVDARDAFTAEVDGMSARDRVALRYLAAQSDVRLTPLPWSRRLILEDATGSFAWIGDEWPEFPRSLARDVVSSLARAPREPGARGSARDTSGTAFAVRYPRGDVDAEALAARVTSLVNRREGTERWISVAAPPASLYGGENPAILSLPRSHFAPPSGALLEAGSHGLTGDRHALVETRAHFVSRPRLAGVRFDWDGVPRLDDVGWGREDSP